LSRDGLLEAARDDGLVVCTSENAVGPGKEVVEHRARDSLPALVALLGSEDLFAALTANRHLCGDRVLRQPSGKPVDENILQDWIEAATRRAGLPVTR
jgi:hypothetical protein